MQAEEIAFGRSHNFALTISLLPGDGPHQGGSLYLRVPGALIGAPGAYVDLTNVRGWLGRYLSETPEVPEPEMLSCTAEDFFFRFYSMPVHPVGGMCVHDLTHRRFSIVEVMDTAFDAFDVLVLTRPEGGERLLWRGANCPPMAHDLPPGEFRTTLRAAYEWMCQAF